MTAPRTRRRSTFAAALGGFLLLGSAWQARAADWVKVESDHFVVRTNAGRANAERLAERLEMYDGFLRGIHKPGDAEGASKLDIYLMARPEDIRAVWPTQGIRGFYAHTGVETPFLVAINRRQRPGDAADPTADDTMQHEYTHHFLLGEFPAAYPGWVIEGYAQYFQTIEFQPGAVLLGSSSPGLRAWVATQRLPWEDVIRGRTSRIPRDKWGSFYGQAWILTHYLMSDPKRTAAFNRYLQLVAAGGDPLDSLLKVLDTDLPTLERQLEAHARAPTVVHRLPWTAPKPGAPFKVETLPDSADDILLADLRGQMTVKKEEKPAYIERMTKLAQAWPNDIDAQLALARAHILHGDPSRVPDILQRYPDDARAQQRIAQSYLVRAEGESDPAARDRLMTQARESAAASYRLDPDNFLTLFTYVQARKGEPDYPSDNSLSALIRAHELYPQVPTVRYELGAALLKRGRNAEAVNVLTPLANNPHGGTTSEQARELVAKAQGGAS